MAQLTCDDVLDAGPSYALDIMEPTRRAEVDAHLDGCGGCRAEMKALEASAAELLDLRERRHLPPAPRHRTADPVGAGRRRLRVATAMVAAAALVVGTTLGPELISLAHHGGVPAFASAPLLRPSSGGAVVGHVYFFAARPTVAIEVAGMSGRGPLTAEMTVAGSTVTLGSFRLYQGHGYWGGSPGVDVAQSTGVALLDQSGQVVAATAGV